MTKMTKREKFAIVREMLVASNHEQKDLLLEFVDHEVELLDKKSGGGSKPTAKQKENLLLMEELYVALGEMTEAVTISEFQEKSASKVATLTNQKISSLLKKLVESGRVKKEVVKKKSYFSVI